LMHGALRTTLVAKLKLAVVVVALAGLGAGGLTFQPGRPVPARAEAPAAGAKDELEALRRENARLKRNLRAALEKLRSANAELRKAKQPRKVVVVGKLTGLRVTFGPTKPADPAREAEAALKALGNARDPEARRRAAAALEGAVKRLRRQLK